MKFVLPACVALTMLGCSGESSPTAATPTAPSPLPAPSASAILRGFVLDPTGGCIEDAAVEVVRGQAQGQRSVQETPCDAWSYGGGFEFKDLVPDVEMTLRASAPGWTTAEKTLLPPLGTQTAVEITLQKMQ